MGGLIGRPAQKPIESPNGNKVINLRNRNVVNQGDLALVA